MSELAVLGAILMDCGAMDAAAPLLLPEDFFTEKHQIIWRTALEMHEAEQPVDNITLTARLRETKQLKRVGGATYLDTLVSDLPDIANVEHYAKLVSDEASRRKISAIGASLSAAQKTTVNVDEALTAGIQELERVATRRVGSSVTNAPTVATEVIRRAKAVASGAEEVRGVKSGFQKLDDLMLLEPGTYNILAARPSVGKTSFALNVATHAALHQQEPVLFVSLEMPKEQLMWRILGNEAEIGVTRLMLGQLDAAGAPNDYDRLDLAQVNLDSCPHFWIEDRSTLDMIQLRALVRKVKARSGLSLVVLDYLQLLSDPTNSANERTTRISRGLKAMAKDFDVPMIALSQLSRLMERENREPVLSDLRDSGSLEQDADRVLFVYRHPDNPTVMQLILRKNRIGPTGKVPLNFDPEYTRFSPGDWDDWGIDD